MIIACDIGGVVRDIATGQPIEGAVEGLADLSRSHQVMFISKCGQSFEEVTVAWLAEQGLSEVPLHFCRSNDDKVAIAKQHGVAVMIDDRIQVLRTFPDSVTKIWLCMEEKKIAGTKQHQPDIFATLQLARSWHQVLDAVEEASEGHA
jgi:hypothetical protein